MLQNAPDFNQEEMKYSGLKVIKQSKELLNGFSKKDIAKRFVAFLQEECKDLGLDQKEIIKIINRLTKYYSKKNSVKDLQVIITSIESLFTNQKFIDRLDNFLSEANITDFAKTFFYQNNKFTYNNLKDSLLARLKRYNLSYKAIGDLSRKEILDVLQVNNRFKGEDKSNHRIIDVKGRGKDKIYLLQNYKTAKMVDGKLVIIQDNIDKNIEPKTQAITKTDIVDELEKEKETKKGPAEDQNGLSKIDEANKGNIDPEQTQDKDINIEQPNQQEKVGVSGKKYKIIENNTRTISRSRKSVNVIDNNGKTCRFILMPDGNVLDSCKGNDGKDYEIIDYISVYQNTGSFDIVRIKDTNGEEQNIRLLIPEYGKFIIQKQILIKRTGIKNWFMKNNLIKYIYRLIGKEYDKKYDIKDFSWDEKRLDFVYTLSNGEKLNMDSLNIIQ